MKNKTYSNFIKKGFAVYKNFFNEHEIERLIQASKELDKNSSGLALHNHQNYWSIINNKKILDVVRALSNESNISYLYNSNAKISSKNNNTCKNYSWHRDSACRIFGIGPDWDKDEIYNVMRVGIYLSADTDSGLNVISESHNKKYNISGILNLLNTRLKNYNFKLIKIFRNFLQKFIGINIKTNKGDMIIFLANLLHSAIPTEKDRVVLFLAYGPNNKHSKNFVNYYMKHRDGWEFKDEETQRKFFESTKKNNTYFPVPEKKKELEGMIIPKKN
tara:strand:- start:331 stop:1155 length:825 start_codon:yes stop_codon:yes gene_type:complete